MLTLEARKREKTEKLENLRKAGFIPCVCYGPKKESTSLSVKSDAFLKVFKEAGESSIITLKTDMGDLDALIYDIAKDPVTSNIKHVDFYIIEKGKKVNVFVPVEFEGVSPAVKDLGGVLVKVLHKVEIEAMPKDLPHELHVDISSLNTFGDQITAGDIKLPSGVTLLTKAEEIVVLASAPKEEKAEESVPIDMASIEVEKKGKKEEVGEEGESQEDSK